MQSGLSFTGKAHAQVFGLYEKITETKLHGNDIDRKSVRT